MFFDSFQPNSFNTHSPHRKLQRVTAHVVLGIPEGATRGVLRNFAKLTGNRCSEKFHKTRQENTCTRLSFLIKLQA